jgi:hypothetical protein
MVKRPDLGCRQKAWVVDNDFAKVIEKAVRSRDQAKSRRTWLPCRCRPPRVQL